MEIVAKLRTSRRDPLLLWGFGPAAVAALLIVLMLWLAPSVAPEKIVTKPVHGTTTTNPVIVP